MKTHITLFFLLLIAGTCLNAQTDSTETRSPAPLSIAVDSSEAESNAWATAQFANTLEAYSIYLNAFPNGYHAPQARAIKKEILGKALFGGSSGMGTGGSGRPAPGFGGRAIVSRPKSEPVGSKALGLVNVSLCINPAGEVVSAEYTEEGSTTSDPDLIEHALKMARGYIFASANTKEVQCGTMKFHFQLQ